MYHFVYALLYWLVIIFLTSSGNSVCSKRFSPNVTKPHDIKRREIFKYKNLLFLNEKLFTT